MERKVALITGVTGQDGSYLSEFLIEKGYDVHGIIRRSSVDYRERIAHLEGHPQFHLPRSVPTRSTTSRPRATCRCRSTRPNSLPT